MVTVPVLTSVGFMRLAVRIAAASLLLLWVKTPAVKTLLGFADDEVKAAPLPTRKAEASTTVAARRPPAAMSLRRLRSSENRFISLLLVTR